MSESSISFFCRPVFAVTDMLRALHYYKTALAFRHDWSAPADADIPICAQVSRGKTEILLWNDPTLQPRARAYITLEHEHRLVALHDELEDNGAIITSPPAPRTWGPYGFIVEDIDQNQLYFVGQAPAAT